MPENQHPDNDPFADLYGRLPDPRTGARSGAEVTPPSRRAAREARRAQTRPAETPATTPPTDAVQGVSEPTASAQAPRFDAARRAGDTPAAADAARRTENAPAAATDAARRAEAPAPAPQPSDAARRAEATPATRVDAPRSTQEPPTARFDAARRAEEPPARRPPEQTAPLPSTAAHGTPARSAAAHRAAAPGTPAHSTTPQSTPAPQPARDREPALVGAGAATAAASSSTPGPVASGSLEDLFTGQTTTHDIGHPAPRPNKRRRRVGGWIALAIVVLLVGGIVGGGFALWNTYGERVQAFFGTGESLDYEAGQATGEARITIVSGDTGESVSPKLFEAGVTKASNSLYKYMVNNSVAFTFQPGVYKLQQQMTSEAVLSALRDPANRLNYTVQLREGLTLKQSLDVISEQIGIPRADLDAATANPAQYGVPASTLEGWIFPATYDFDEGVTATDVISRMVQRTVQSLDTAGVPAGDRERILTIASIIEREARSSEDFYKVSRVIENRLQPDNTETHGLLQMDSTAQYGAGELDAGSSSSSENALTSDNPWNTYVHPGLPVGPIANPGDLAIDAAMHPVDGPWYYFTTVNLATGETVFSASYADQEKAVEQFRAWCRENPDGGC